MNQRIASLSALAAVAICAAAGNPAVIKVNVPAGGDGKAPELMVHNNEPSRLMPDGHGGYVDSVEIATPMYASLYCNNVMTQIWLKPGSNVAVTIGATPGERSFAGDNADVNSFLNGESGYRFATINDTGRDEADFLHFTDSLDIVNHQLLASVALPDDFKAQESTRIFYENVRTLASYPDFHPRLKREDSDYRPSDEYYKKLRDAAVYDSSLLNSKAYTNFISASLGRLSHHAFPELNGIDRLTAYLDSCVKDHGVAQYIFNSRARSALTRGGLEQAKPYVDAYPRYVTDSSMSAQFKRLYDEVSMLAPGQPSPVFDCESVDGTRHKLSDYAGRWLYIDIWATWCGPCRREIPYLKKLEERFADAPITFISISTDNDRDAWSTLVTEQKMGGEQLRFDGHDKFMESYKITGIPRFILIDPEGKIVDSDMSRPSSPSTAEKLERLL